MMTLRRGRVKTGAWLQSLRQGVVVADKMPFHVKRGNMPCQKS
jgi:hypothetical protein